MIALQGNPIVGPYFHIDTITKIEADLSCKNPLRQNCQDCKHAYGMYR